MANGPPTPPPITTVEIEDEAKTTVAESTISQPTETADEAGATGNPPAQQTESSGNQASSTTVIQPLQPDPFESALPKISELVAASRFRELIEDIEVIDLTTHGENSPNRMLVMIPLVLAYLIRDEIALARMAMKRLPRNLTEPRITQTLGALLLAVSERDYPKVYARAEDFIDYAGKPDFPHQRLGTLIKNMIPIFVATFRERTFTLLSRGYSSITPTMASKYIGLPIQHVTKMATDRRWTYDPSTETLTPTVTRKGSKVSYAGSPPSTLRNFESIADSVSKLEA
ncbi:cop9 signalosome complex subunit 8 [Moniliophthora roreri MCA 2997]|uniref:Cop9 signalosome complex subunit 8 n=2 Tax=Moniliophthora roreri TaxID=221103 RepID=V2XKB7_MONRO|nr:cop9 signalosome complex subunit 8 [Moniliophthora roreri MCA 2997]KAI3619289.1 cop9 signalosome complex subunit 8 [Moniliophthora roreri]